MKIIITGRPHILITMKLRCSTAISLDSANVSKDIYKYVANNVRELSVNRQLEQEIQDALVKGAKGMFLWVSLIVGSLDKIKHSTPKHIRQKLKELPKDITALYVSILNQINAEYEVKARMILQWIVYAARPLTLKELAIAIAVTPVHTSLEDMYDDMELDLEQLLHVIFGPFLVVGSNRTVNLVHQSAKDFLFDISSEGQGTGNLGLENSFGDLSSRLGLSRQDANTVLSTACMSYLCFDAFGIGPTCASIWDRGPLINLEKRYLFLNYAAMYWHHHLHYISYDKMKLSLSGIFQKVIRSESNINLSYQMYVFARFEKFHYTKLPQIAARLGICVLVEELLNIGAEVNAEGGRYGNALQAAVSEGNEAVVRLLVDRGADVNAQGGRYGNALQAAAFDGNEAVVQLLVDRGANVNAQGGLYGNALQTAVSEGNEAVVQLLVDQGADVNAQGGRYGNALQAAACKGNEAVVQLLVDRGADINAQGGFYGNALQAAAFDGNEAVVQLLVDRGADVNAKGGRYSNALQAAVSENNEAVVWLLVDQGADVNAQGGRYSNALQAAVSEGNEAVVRLLVDRGADVNAQGGRYGNALQATARKGNEAVVRLLVDRGADVNAQGGEYGNALQAAAGQRGGGPAAGGSRGRRQRSGRPLRQRSPGGGTQGQRGGGPAAGGSRGRRQRPGRPLRQRSPGRRCRRATRRWSSCWWIEGPTSTPRAAATATLSRRRREGQRGGGPAAGGSRGVDVNAPGRFRRATRRWYGNAAQGGLRRRCRRATRRWSSCWWIEGPTSMLQGAATQRSPRQRSLVDGGADVNAASTATLSRRRCQRATRRWSSCWWIEGPTSTPRAANTATLSRWRCRRATRRWSSCWWIEGPMLTSTLSRRRHARARAVASGGSTATLSNALRAAVSKGNEAVVQLLVDRGADVNAKDGRYGNALQAAAFDGGMVWLLVDGGAGNEATWSSGGPAAGGSRGRRQRPGRPLRQRSPGGGFEGQRGGGPAAGGSRGRRQRSGRRIRQRSTATLWRGQAAPCRRATRRWSSCWWRGRPLRQRGGTGPTCWSGSVRILLC
jgi:ankyrin repeat protein